MYNSDFIRFILVKNIYIIISNVNIFEKEYFLDNISNTL